MFVLNIKIHNIVVLGVVSNAIMFDERLYFLSSFSLRDVSMVSLTRDNISGDSFFITTSRQYACQH